MGCRSFHRRSVSLLASSFLGQRMPRSGVNSDRARRFFAARLLFPACVAIIGYASGWECAQAAAVLTEPELDAVNAGLLQIELDLSASADGPNAVTSTQGAIAVADTTVVRISIDPSAPPPAQAHLLGVSQAEIGIAHGTADASGGNNPKCAANVNVEGGDSVQTTQTSTITVMAATCACSAFVVDLLTR